MTTHNCPFCGATLKDWREFVKKFPELAAKEEFERPFECVGFRCGKRWKAEEILQKQEEK